MRIRHTRHARNRMRLYKLSSSEVEEIVSLGDIKPARGGKQRATKLIRAENFSVIFVDEGDIRYIITVYPERRTR